VKPLVTVAVAPEVSGKVVEIHPRLRPGEVIPQGEVLFRIDDRNYEAAKNEAEATVEQLRISVERLRKQYGIEQERLETLQRSRDLAKAEFDRVTALYEEDNVGTRSGVEAAERNYNQAKDQAAQLAQAVELYPIRIREAESSLVSAESRLERASADLERCTVAAPFNARVKESRVEAGQYTMPGNPVLTLADDSILEIHVPLDSRDARRWLEFDGTVSRPNAAWFNGLKPVTVTIRWTEDPGGHCWTGELHRVVKFDEQTRTLTVAVRVPAGRALSEDGNGLPLVEGMFAMVEIPGRTLREVFRLPRIAVSFKNTVYTSVSDRLVTVPVEVARIEGDEALVAGGLETGDIVIVNRLIDPLENSLLDVTLREGEERES
jgi:multidrug efflux pump subunit AcrA (membrane-fusion protein)